MDVRDNGPGISESDQEIIFEKFRQVGDTLTDKPQGTGLGCPSAARSSTISAAACGCESRPGEGATFSFTLPLHARRARARPPEPTWRVT